MRRAAGVLEHGDRPLPPATLGPYLDDIERLNAWFGGYALTSRAVRRVTRVADAHTVVVADVGGARGDLAVRLIRDVRRPVRIVVVDRDEASLVMGQRSAKPYPGIWWVQADAAALPFRDGSIDVAVMSLTLHHLEPDAAVATLADMRRTARLGLVVNDLLRSRLGHALVWLATRLFARHPFSRHDGPLSVRRSYSADELRALAARAGLSRVSIRRHPWLARLVAVAT